MRWSHLTDRLLGVRLHTRWRKKGGWLGEYLPTRVPRAPRKRDIEAAAQRTNQLGDQRLADEYGEVDGHRTPDDVRTSAVCGDLYAWVVWQRRPLTIVEFGSAFGVSGMYFGSGLAAVGYGHLYSFEINDEWAIIAEKNIGRMTDRFTLTRGSFEDHVDRIVTTPIDLAFVDGIHTYEFVMRQYAILRQRSAPGALLAFDDIDFKKPGARMREAWDEIAAGRDITAAVEVNGRVGLIELP